MAAFNVTEVQSHLKGAGYPAGGDDLANLAQSNGASADLVDALRGLGEVDGPDEVMRELQPLLGNNDEG